MQSSPLRILLYGSRHEIDRCDIAYMEEHARRWASDSRLTLEERERIERVWLRATTWGIGTYQHPLNPTPERLRQLEELLG